MSRTTETRFNAQVREKQVLRLSRSSTPHEGVFRRSPEEVKPMFNLPKPRPRYNLPLCSRATPAWLTQQTPADECTLLLIDCGLPYTHTTCKQRTEVPV